MFQRLLRILELFHVREKAARFHRVQKSSRSPGGPDGEGRLLWKTVERVIDLDRIKSFRVMFEPAPLRKRDRVKIAPPVFVFPARAANSWRAHRKEICNARLSLLPRWRRRDEALSDV